MQTLKLYNTLTRTKEPFNPLDPNNLRMYACGPTVYNYAHIGNARMSVVADQLVRVLRHLFPKVTYVSNITDIDDKIIQAAEDSGQEIASLTRHYAKIYNSDMAALGCREPDIQPKATAFISEMIAVISSLIDKGHAYVAANHVLFDVNSYEAYGKLSGRTLEEQQAGNRIDVADFKRAAGDFVLWKPSSGSQPGWESPWGFGRPGWHIECSAMSAKTLGLPFDIHGGGVDLTFPHHENEIAQSCCAQGIINNPQAYARYWFHNGFVTVNGEKMSKSVGNVILVHNLIDQIPGETLRLALLSTHYRQPLDWTAALIEQSSKILDKMYRLLMELDEPTATEPTEVPEAVMEALLDDLNTAKAITRLTMLAADINKTTNLQEKRRLVKGLMAGARLLGLLNQNPLDWLGYGQGSSQISSQQIDLLIQERSQARVQRNFKRADEIREELKQQGIELEDSPEGTVWRRI